MSRHDRRGLPAAPAVAAPADRRFRRADVATRRRRYGRTARRALRWTLPILGVCALVGWLGTRVLDSDLLRIRRIVVTGTTHLAQEDVELLLEGIHGETLLRADLPAYRRRLLDSPWVADARLSRVLPGTVAVHVTERVPMAIARFGEQMFLVDVNGVVIDEFGPRYDAFDLPVVNGLIVSLKGGASSVPVERVRLVSSLLTALDARPDLRRDVSEVDVSNPRDAVVLYGTDSAWLHLGDTRFVERLQNYLDLRSTLRERFQGRAYPDYVDLRFDERVYLRGPAARAVSR